MKKLLSIPKKSRIGLIKVAVFAMIMGIAGQQLLRFSSAASGPTLYVSPASGSIEQNKTIDVKVLLDTASQDVDGVEAYLTYPAAQLEFVRIDAAGSAFGIEFPSNGGGGSIVIRRTVNPDSSRTVNGSSLLVATVTLKALGGSGSAAINYTPQSRVTAPSAGTGSVLAYMSGGQYTLTTAPTAPTAPTSPTAPPASTSAAPGSPPANPPAGSGSTSGSTGTSTGTTQTSNKRTTTPTNAVTQPSPAQQTPQPNIVPAVKINNSKLSADVSRHKKIVLLAKIAGFALILGSLGMVAKLLFTLRHHHVMMTAMAGPSIGGVPYDSNIPHSPDHTLESQVFKSSQNTTQTTALEHIKSADVPAPGDVVGPQDETK